MWMTFLVRVVYNSSLSLSLSLNTQKKKKNDWESITEQKAQNYVDILSDSMLFGKVYRNWEQDEPHNL